MKTLLARATLIGLVMVVAIELYGDPYTHHAASDEPFTLAPVWRTLVILLEFGLLVFHLDPA